MIPGEIIIEVLDEKFGWCLQQLVNFDNAESELEQLQQKFPEKQFRITTMSKEDAREAWWNKSFLD